MTSPMITLVGCGNMGGAMLSGWLRQGHAPSSILVIDPGVSDVPAGVTVLPAPTQDIEQPAALILAVKPQMLTEVAPNLMAMVGADTLLVSILAAVDIATLRKTFPNAASIVRAVPNLPGSLGLGITALAAEPLEHAQTALVESLCSPLGRVEWLYDEVSCDAATLVSGCGPAFLFRFAAAIVEEGELHGLSPEQGRRLIGATMVGAGTMLLQTETDLRGLARRVASPGGVTEAGLKVLDRDNALGQLVAETFAAAAKRNEEITAASRWAPSS